MNISAAYTHTHTLTLYTPWGHTTTSAHGRSSDMSHNTTAVSGHRYVRFSNAHEANAKITPIPVDVNPHPQHFPSPKPQKTNHCSTRGVDRRGCGVSNPRKYVGGVGVCVDPHPQKCHILSLHCALSLAVQCIVIGPVCGGRAACLRVCYHDNSKLRALIFTKLGL